MAVVMMKEKKMLKSIFKKNVEEEALLIQIQLSFSSLWPLGSFSLSPIYGMYAISRFLEVRAQYRACNVEEGEVVISKSWRRSRWWW